MPFTTLLNNIPVVVVCAATTAMEVRRSKRARPTLVFDYIYEYKCIVNPITVALNLLAHSNVKIDTFI